MTRRERAAMALALEVLRGGVAEHGPAYRWIHGAAAFHVGSAHNALIFGRDGDGKDLVPTAGEHVPSRLLRARLALYLRARLRAERGERGPRRYRPTGQRCRNLRHNRDRHGRCRHASCGCYVCHRRITPLWEQAPAHGCKEAKNG